jgi:hypothetical protein
MRTCSRCGEDKEASAYSPDKRTRDGCQSKCRSCMADIQYLYRVENQEKTNREARESYDRRKNSSKYNTSVRASTAKRLYGLTLAEYDAMMAGPCGICGVHTDSMHLDHDHATGKPRGGLCREHNIGLGYFQDNPEMLERAAQYLRDHR